MEDLAVLVPLVVLAASGLAACAVAPDNNAARALLLAGVLLNGSWFVDVVAEQTDVHGAVLASTGDVLFLGGLAAVVGLLATYPDGSFERAWQRASVAVLAGAALLGPLLASAGQRALQTVGDFVVVSEPAWLLLGLVIGVRRWRGAAGAVHRELGRLLASVALLGVLLAMIVVGGMTQLRPPEVLFTALFLVALGLLPLELLRGITARARGLHRELSQSRARIVAAEDLARRRIERDLHDGAQQQLVAILSMSELAIRQTPQEAGELRRTLADVRAQVSSAITDLRELVSGIRPPVLEDAGVAAALESRLEKLPVDVTMDLTSARGLRWSGEVEATAYFVVCEAVTNALKHARHSPVGVRLDVFPGKLRVVVEDQGPGLPPMVAEATSGLAGLRDRVESLGGTLLVESGRGVRLTATLPAEQR